jgi:hypothetical protein
MEATISKLAPTLFVLNTILSFGLNLLIARLGLDPRWRYLVWGLLIANEIRGLYVVYTGGDYALDWVLGLT